MNNEINKERHRLYLVKSRKPSVDSRHVPFGIETIKISSECSLLDLSNQTTPNKDEPWKTKATEQCCQDRLTFVRKMNSKDVRKPGIKTVVLFVMEL